jgi:hypothetical protein
MTGDARSEVELWGDYLFLTREMHKFLVQNNFDMFNNLIGQREKLQKVLGVADSGEFRRSAGGMELFRSIQQENVIIDRELRRRQNGAKKNEQLATAYDVFLPKPVGRMMDHKG